MTGLLVAGASARQAQSAASPKVKVKPTDATEPDTGNWTQRLPNAKSKLERETRLELATATLEKSRSTN